MTDTVMSTQDTEPKVAEPVNTPAEKTAAKVGGKKPSAKKVAKKVSKKAKTVKTTSKKAEKVAKRVGLLACAYEVLRGSKAPLSINEIMERIQKRKLWSPPNKGKTPSRTLSAAVIRACKEKGSLFRKVSKGHFSAKK